MAIYGGSIHQDSGQGQGTAATLGSSCDTFGKAQAPGALGTHPRSFLASWQAQLASLDSDLKTDQTSSSGQQGINAASDLLNIAGRFGEVAREEANTAQSVRVSAAPCRNNLAIDLPVQQATQAAGVALEVDGIQPPTSPVSLPHAIKNSLHALTGKSAFSELGIDGTEARHSRSRRSSRQAERHGTTQADDAKLVSSSTANPATVTPLPIAVPPLQSADIQLRLVPSGLAESAEMDTALPSQQRNPVSTSADRIIATTLRSGSDSFRASSRMALKPLERRPLENSVVTAATPSSDSGEKRLTSLLAKGQALASNSDSRVEMPIPSPAGGAKKHESTTESASRVQPPQTASQVESQETIVSSAPAQKILSPAQNNEPKSVPKSAVVEPLPFPASPVHAQSSDHSGPVLQSRSGTSTTASEASPNHSTILIDPEHAPKSNSVESSGTWNPTGTVDSAGALFHPLSAAGSLTDSPVVPEAGAQKVPSGQRDSATNQASEPASVNSVPLTVPANADAAPIPLSSPDALAELPVSSRLAHGAASNSVHKAESNRQSQHLDRTLQSPMPLHLETADIRALIQTVGNPTSHAVTAAATSQFTGPAAFSPSGTFAALDADFHPESSNWTHMSTHRAEAGFQDPSLGWIGVRAESSRGQVHASVVPDSNDAAQALGGHMAGLHAHLAITRTPVDTITLTAPNGGGSAFGGALGQGSDRNPDQSTGHSGGFQPDQTVQPGPSNDSIAVRSGFQSEATQQGFLSEDSGGHVSLIA